MGTLELDPALVVTLRTLQEHRVEFVLAGDLARAIHDNGGFVAEMTIVPAAYRRNTERLCAALLALDAQLIAAGDGSAHAADLREADLQALSPCVVQTPALDVEVCFAPPGTGGYRDLFDEAARVALARGAEPLVAAAADLERIRRAGAPQPAAARPAWGAAEITARRA
jgi:hypothetical protein